MIYVANCLTIFSIYILLISSNLIVNEICFVVGIISAFIGFLFSMCEIFNRPYREPRKVFKNGLDVGLGIAVFAITINVVATLFFIRWA